MDKSEQPQPALPAHHGLKDISLKASGWGFFLGDAALFAAGLKERNPKAAFAALSWTAGGIAAAYGGNPNAEKQLELLSRRLARHLRENHVAIPDQPSLALMNRPDGVIQHIDDFLHKHPADILNAFSVLGGGQLALSGHRNRFAPDMACGLLVMAGGLAGLLIKEKKPDADHPPQNGLGKFTSWVQEKPLRVTGTLQTANNAVMFWASRKKFTDYRTQGSHVMRFAAAASYLFANAMLFMSSKENDTVTHPQIHARIAQMSAQVIAAQPREIQEALLQDVAQYLSRQPGSPAAEKLNEMLHAQLKIMSTSQNASMSWKDKINNNQVIASEPTLG